MDCSVIVIAYNEEKDISDCISSILNQSHKEFELIIVNDGSKDNTKKKIQNFKDKRIIYVEHKTNLGFASARNSGLNKSKGELIFFTDADCIADKDWLKEGRKFMLNNQDIVGCGGYTTAKKSTKSESSLLDRKAYMKSTLMRIYPYPATLNCCYRRKDLKLLRGFNERYNEGVEDSEIALKLTTKGLKLGFCNMKIKHKSKKMNLKRGLTFVKRNAPNVYLIKDFGKIIKEIRKSSFCYNFIVEPNKLIALLFPPYLLYYSSKKLKRKITSFEDIIFLFFIYFGLLYGRFLIWKTAFKERIFLI